MSGRRRATLWKWLDYAAVAGMALGVAAILQPWWGSGLRVGFFATLGFTVLHIVTSHVHKPEAL